MLVLSVLSQPALPKARFQVAFHLAQDPATEIRGVFRDRHVMLPARTHDPNMRSLLPKLHTAKRSENPTELENLHGSASIPPG